ncbi:hypothetical protein [Lentzea kentuckyensis]|uniref:hypothetical protein n=1 Tax=Lentzea kentuckyensis TaxID=360086 RepID=UPI000A382D2B|nr:hypothetical protein [Lentzea kentuckyensis]
MIRLLGAFGLVVALASCTAQPQATSPSPTSPTAPTTTTTVTTTSPRIDTPRNVTSVDPCALFTEQDLTKYKYGPFSVPPAPYPQIPGTCAATFGTGGPEDLVVLVGVLPRAYDAEKAANPNGHQGLIEGHNVWFSCGGDAAQFVCTAWAAVAPEHSLTVSLGQKDGRESRLLLNTQSLITDVLARMPRAS